MQKDSRIFIAGHRGLVGTAIQRRLVGEGFTNLLLKTRAELDLCDARAVSSFFEAARPEYVFFAAAKVGGILANSTYPVDFLRDNLMVELNLIESAWRSGAKKLQFLGSSCIYPKLSVQPIREESLLTGPLEPTNEWYAIAKIAGIKLVQAYRQQYGFPAISIMPTNLYGPNDNFDLQLSHVLPALIRKVHQAKKTGNPEVVVWGTGTPRREFLHVDDLADAAVYLMHHYDDGQPINVGFGEDITIAELVEMICKTIGYEGGIVFDRSKPDGTMRKLLDVSRLQKIGWKPSIDIKQGIASTYDWFLKSRWADAD